MVRSIRKRYRNIPLNIKAAIWFTFTNFLLKGLSFIIVPLNTRILSVSEYGIVSVFLSYQQFFLIFSTFELYLGAYQRGMLQFKDDIDRFTRSLILLCNSISIVLFLIILKFKRIFIFYTKSNIIVLFLMVIYFLFLPGFNCWIIRKRFDYTYKPVVIATILTSSIISIGTSIIVFFGERTALNYLQISLVLEILCYLPFYIKEVFPPKKGMSTVINKYWKYCLRFQLPLVAHSLSYFILGQADRIMIGMLVNDEKAGIYSVAYSLANVVIIFQTSINQVIQPWRYKKLEEKNYSIIENSTNQIVLITGYLILFFVLIAPEIMKWLFSKDYYEAIWTIPPIAISILFMMMYTIFTDIESYFYKTNYIMIASIVCAMVNIFLNYLGITFWGYIACGYTTLISYILFAVLHYYFMKKVCIKAGIQQNLIDGKRLLILGSIIILFTGILVTIYNYWIIRYVIVLIMLLLAYLYIKKIIRSTWINIYEFNN